MSPGGDIVPGLICTTLTASDGLKLRVAHLPGPGRTVVLLGGRTEFIEKYAETIADLHRRGFAVVTMDWRGQGLSGRMLANPHKGHVERYEDYLADLALVVERKIEPAQRGRLILLAHSMGGHIGLRFLHDHPGLFGCAVLSAPMVDIFDNAVPRQAARAMCEAAVASGRGQTYVPGRSDVAPGGPRFENNALTSNRARFAAWAASLDAAPELALGGVTQTWLRATLRSIRILNAAGYPENIATPTLLCTPAADTIVSVAAQTRLAGRMRDARQHLILDARHELLIERDAFRDQFWRAFDEFVDLGFPDVYS